MFCAVVFLLIASDSALFFLLRLSLLSKQLSGPLECSPGFLQLSSLVILSSIFFVISSVENNLYLDLTMKDELYLYSQDILKFSYHLMKHSLPRGINHFTKVTKLLFKMLKPNLLFFLPNHLLLESVAKS